MSQDTVGSLMGLRNLKRLRNRVSDHTFSRHNCCMSSSIIFDERGKVCLPKPRKVKSWFMSAACKLVSKQQMLSKNSVKLLEVMSGMIKTALLP